MAHRVGDATHADDLDLGDFVEATGETMATDKGELSLNPTTLRLLTKAMRPLPTKTSFNDVEQRYRMRYVDLVANREVEAVFRARAAIVSAIREFLDTRGFVEVETPTMSTIVGGALAKPFSTHHNALDMPLFLRIADELYLKRLVVGGFDRVYEVGHDFRNEGIDRTHNPEFTMLEFYQAYADYREMMDVVEALIAHVAAAVRAVPGVAQAAVGVREDHRGVKRLVAHLSGQVDVAEVRARLAERLPDHLVPSAFVVLDSPLPLTPNGKLDTNIVSIPTERYGFSRDAKGRMGPPSFDDAAVDLQADTTIAVKLF